ncbi:MAG: hypothetical protein AAGA36_00160 [Pseudomonadota bacterium]
MATTSQPKAFWKSKTFWVNFIAIVASILSVTAGVNIDPELQATIVGTVMGVVNIVLRFTTAGPVTLK